MLTTRYYIVQRKVAEENEKLCNYYHVPHEAVWQPWLGIYACPPVKHSYAYFIRSVVNKPKLK